MKTSFAVIAVFFASINAWTCDCPIPDLKTNLATADAVFIGTPLLPGTLSELETPEKKSKYLLIPFQIEKSWKGPKGHKAQIKVGKTLCSFQFQVGEKYLVFSSSQEPSFTSICSRTNIVKNAKKDIKALGKSIPLK